MSKHVNLGLVFHDHQPVGNYDFVFEELYNLSYEPMVGALERHPKVRAGLHHTGPLLEWLADNRPGYLERVAALAARGQVEIIGGAYYEPILSAISGADRIGQLEKMADEIERLFGKRPTGAWLAERVWEPGLPVALAAAGYSWTIVDDVHFFASGVRPEQINNWYLTESEGSRLGVFGSSTRFRYIVPWGTVDQAIDHLRSHGDRKSGGLVVMGDDGEKFGGWPTTYKHCWENGWVDRFFQRLEDESHWIGTVHLGDWQMRHQPESLIYLPTMSYMEMGEWSLNHEFQHELQRARQILREHGGEELAPLLRGGHWSNFLVRYPEVNLLQKRLLALSKEAREAESGEALDHVWRAECNCPFWHGVFGGVYLENIRNANFLHMAAADALLHPGAQEPEVRDFDYDGADEVCLRSERHLAIVAPARGGEIQQWELRQVPWHLTHVVARRPEAYHVGLGDGDTAAVHSIHDAIKVLDPTVFEHLGKYDLGMRVASQDTVLQAGATRDEYREARLSSAAKVAHWHTTHDAVELECSAAGLSYRKRIAVSEALSVSHHGTGEGALFTEYNLSLPGKSWEEPTEFVLEDGELRIDSGTFKLIARHNARDVWHHQVFSVSNTEGGVELAPQGWAIIFSTAAQDGAFSLDISWSLAE